MPDHLIVLPSYTYIQAYVCQTCIFYHFQKIAISYKARKASLSEPSARHFLSLRYLLLPTSFHEGILYQSPNSQRPHSIVISGAEEERNTIAKI